MPNFSQTDPPSTDVCELRIQALRKLEDLSKEASYRIDTLEQKVMGLSDAHKSTLMVVQQSNETSNRIAKALDHIGAKLDSFTDEFMRHKEEFALHRLSNIREEYRWPKLAIWLWAATLTAVSSITMLLVLERAAIKAFLQAALNHL